MEKKKTSTDWLMRRTMLCRLQTTSRSTLSKLMLFAVIDNQFQKNLFFFSLKSMLIHDGVWKIWYFFSISASSISLTCKNRVIYHTILGDVAFRSFLHEYIHILFCVFSPLLCQRQCEWRNGRREENLLKKKNR